MGRRFARVPVIAATKGLSGCALRVLIAICAHADPQGECWPGLKRIAAITNIRQKKLSSLIKKLEQTELLERQRGIHRSTHYKIRYSDAIGFESGTDVPQTGSGATSNETESGVGKPPQIGADATDIVPHRGGLTAQDSKQLREQLTAAFQTLIDESDLSRARDAYNDLAKEHDLPLADGLSKRVEANLRVRLAECGGIDGWCVVMDRIRATPFLLGMGDRGWRPNFEWICKPGNFKNILNGYYEPSKRRKASGSVIDELDAQFADILRRDRDE